MLDIWKLCKCISCKSEPKINEEAKQLSLVMQEKIPQSSQIIHELAIKKEANVLYQKYRLIPKYMCVCVWFVCLFIYIYVCIYLYLKKKSLWVPKALTVNAGLDLGMLHLLLPSAINEGWI